MLLAGRSLLARPRSGRTGGLGRFVPALAGLALLGAASAAMAQTASIPYTATAPTIDGTVDGVWSSATAYSITKVIPTISSGSDCSATYKALWDNTNLYVLIDVTDDAKRNDSTDPWADDSVEVYVDGNNDKTTTYDANDRQVVLGWGDAAPVEGAGRNITGVTFAKSDPTGTSYRMELKIPWSTLGVTASSGKNIGIDVHVNDDDDGTARDGKLLWNDPNNPDQAWTNPSVFGVGTLGAPPAGLPAGWSAADIGGPTPAGSSSESGGTWTIKGGGADIWGASDQFQYAYKDASGDVTVIANCTALQNTNAWAKGGVMVRDGTAANAMFAFACITPSNGVRLQYRPSTGGNAVDVGVAGIAAPRYLRLVRSGNSFTASYSSDGSTWSSVGSATVAMPAAAKAGLALTSHAQGTLNTSTFNNVSITVPVGQVAAPTFNPAPGTYTSNQSVSISTATSGATIRYTTDGSTPSQSVGTVYSTPVSITTTTTLKAIAYKSGMTDSSVTTGVYTINPPSNTNYLGLNHWFLTDWSGAREFADAMKECRDYQAIGGGSNAPLDSNGWPTTDCQVVVWHGITRMNGTYALSFNGQATVAGAWSNVTISGQTYNSSTNTTTATLVNNTTDGSGLQLTFTNTKRTSTSATNTGLTNIKLMRPTTEGGATSYSTSTLFSNQIKNVVVKTNAIRFMDWLATNANQLSNWSDRTRPTYARQTRQFNSHDAGISIEYAIQFCNETGKDMWINIPCLATDDYVTKVAQLVKYGSDGNLPYTSTQGSPVYAPLNSSLKVYVEYSNELWNTAGGFDQSFQNRDAAVANPSPMNYDGSTDQWTLAWRRTAARSVQISNLFRAVWGDADMNGANGRVRMTLNGQLGYADGPQLKQFEMLINYYANPARVATPRLPSYYFWGYGGSAYMDASDTSTVDQIFATMPANVPIYQQETDWAAGWGLKRVAYEGGPSLPNNATGNSAWSDARMRTEVKDNHNNLWSANGGELLVYYTSVASSPEWSFTRDAFDTSTQKLLALSDLYGVTRTANSYGTLLPATISASSYKRPPSWFNGNPSSMTNGNWFTYTCRATTARTYTFTLNTTATATGSVELVVDGVSQGTISVPVGTNVNTASKTVSLGVGVHGIAIIHRGGSFAVNSINVQ